MVDLYIQGYTPYGKPPQEVIDVIDSGVVTRVRRCEIYEADATTLWLPGGIEDPRMIDGSIIVDYNSDERRKLDLTLFNLDQSLRPNPLGGFWYDKVIKMWSGVRYSSSDVTTRIVIIEAQGGETSAIGLKQVFAAIGFTSVDINLSAETVDEVSDYSMVVSYMQTTPTAKPNLLAASYASGKNVVTIGTGNTVDEVPHYATTPTTGGSQYGVDPVSGDSPVAGSFTSQSEGGSGTTGTLPSGVAAGVQRLAEWTNADPVTFVTAALVRNGTDALWADFHLPSVTGSQVRALIGATLLHIKNFRPYRTWEVQQGEFYIDNIGFSNFPHTTKITARDATKKLMLSKIARTLTFEINTSLKTLIVGELALAGIPVSKMRLDIGDEVTTSDMSFERGTSRWDIIKSALDSFNYERFFDGAGNFVARKYLDPSTSPTDWEFTTGPRGNLVSSEKSVNDSRLYNHIIVTSDPTDEETNPIGYFGEALIEDENSPVHSDRIGDRVDTLDAAWVSSDEECVALAESRLAIASLESYELSFSSVSYPWLECGSIVRVEDPDAFDFEPDRYLLDSITYNVGLGPMDATGKRVTFVGSSGGTGE